MFSEYDKALLEQGLLIIATDRQSSVADVRNERKALHEHIEIKLFYEGTADLLIGPEVYNVTAGDAVVINPYEFHATVGCGEKRGKYHLLMVSPDYFNDIGIPSLDLRAMFFARQEHFKTLYRSNERIIRIISDIAAEHNKGAPFYEAVIKGLMTELFGVLLRIGLIKHEAASLKHNMLHSYNLIEPAMRYIRDNYASHIMVDELSSLCGVSKHYFCRVFKNVTGKTALEHLLDYRLAVADSLLDNTDKSITTIAEACGFESANYLCRCYKKKFGLPPGKSRNRRA